MKFDVFNIKTSKSPFERGLLPMGHKSKKKCFLKRGCFIFYDLQAASRVQKDFLRFLSKKHQIFMKFLVKMHLKGQNFRPNFDFCYLIIWTYITANNGIFKIKNPSIFEAVRAILVIPKKVAKSTQNLLYGCTLTLIAGSQLAKRQFGDWFSYFLVSLMDPRKSNFKSRKWPI